MDALEIAVGSFWQVELAWQNEDETPVDATGTTIEAELDYIGSRLDDFVDLNQPLAAWVDQAGGLFRITIAETNMPLGRLTDLKITLTTDSGQKYLWPRVDIIGID